MSYSIIATDPFTKKVKRLAKKYKSISLDLRLIIEELEKNPTLGIHLGNDCYKIRLAISSKGKGKSSGARIITYVRVVKNTVFLMNIYDKSEQDSISEKEIKQLISTLTSQE